MPKSIPNPASVYYREPRLLVPGKKPTGPVKIDWSHALAEGLEAFTMLDGVAGSGMDLVVDNPLSFNDQHSTAVLRGNQSLEITRSAQADAAFFQPKQTFYRNIVRKMTVIVRCKFSSIVTFAALAAVPYRATGWSSPWLAMSFGRYSTTTQGRLFLARSGAPSEARSATGFLDLNIRTYAVTLDAARPLKASFYRDGEFYSSETRTLQNTDIDWNTKNPLVFGNVSPTGESLESSPVEEEFAIIYSRVLEDRELREIHADPYQFLLSK